MRIDARSLFTGCALGTIILSIWSYQLQAATSGRLLSWRIKPLVYNRAVSEMLRTRR